MGWLAQDGEVLWWQDKGQSPWLRAWARNTIRVRSNLSGAEWLNAWDGTRYASGTRVDVPAPLDTIPVMLRNASRLARLFRRDA